jgi:hypothetical protein
MGRLPIRVELQALTRDDMRRILTEPEASLDTPGCLRRASSNVSTSRSRGIAARKWRGCRASLLY